jgi:hypothetical protein
LGRYRILYTSAFKGGVMKAICHRIRPVLFIVLVLVSLNILPSGCTRSTPEVNTVPPSVSVNSRTEPQHLKRGQEAWVNVAVEITYEDGQGSETFITTASVQPENGLRFVSSHGQTKVESWKGRWAKRTLSMWPAEQRRLEFLLQVSPDIEVGRYKIKIEVKQGSDSSMVYDDALVLLVDE